MMFPLPKAARLLWYHCVFRITSDSHSFIPRSNTVKLCILPSILPDEKATQGIEPIQLSCFTSEDGKDHNREYSHSPVVISNTCTRPQTADHPGRQPPCNQVYVPIKPQTLHVPLSSPSPGSLIHKPPASPHPLQRPQHFGDTHIITHGLSRTDYHHKHRPQHQPPLPDGRQER